MSSKNNQAGVFKKFTFLKFICTLLLSTLVLIIISPTFTYCIGCNEYGRVTRFQKLVKNESDMGIHFKVPIIDKVEKIKSYTHIYDVPASIVTTKDQLKVVVDMIAYWRVTDPVHFAESLRSSVKEAETRIDAAVYSSVKNTFGSRNRDEIISTDLESVQAVADKASEQVKDSMSDYGLEVIIYLKKTDPTVENFDSIYDRMIADRNRKAQEFRSEAVVKSNIIKNEATQYQIETVASATAYSEKRHGEADAEYTRIISSIYDTAEKADFYNKVRELDALRETLLNSSDTTIFLDDDSVLVQILNGNRVG